LISSAISIADAARPASVCPKKPRQFLFALISRKSLHCSPAGIPPVKETDNSIHQLIRPRVPSSAKYSPGSRIKPDGLLQQVGKLVGLPAAVWPDAAPTGAIAWRMGKIDLTRIKLDRIAEIQGQTNSVADRGVLVAPRKLAGDSAQSHRQGRRIESETDKPRSTSQHRLASGWNHQVRRLT